MDVKLEKGIQIGQNNFNSVNDRVNQSIDGSCLSNLVNDVNNDKVLMAIDSVPNSEDVVIIENKRWCQDIGNVSQLEATGFVDQGLGLEQDLEMRVGDTSGSKNVKVVGSFCQAQQD